jgi:hypothetical protein
MDHDHVKENWSRVTNRTPGCSCPAWRYSPRHPKPTNQDCPEHGANRWNLMTNGTGGKISA